MRRRRLAKSRNDVDWPATNAMAFRHRASCILIDGRWILAGADHAAARLKAYVEWDAAGRLCGICGRRVVGEPDWDHVIPKGKGKRNDAPVNRQFVHSMFDVEPCHREKHNRQVRWSKKAVADTAGALNT